MAITVKELIKELKTCNPDAMVYVYADHGQLEEQSSGIYKGTDEEELCYYGEDMCWGSFNMDDEEYINPKKCTAICIG